MAKRLHVTPTTNAELTKKWKHNVYLMGDLYIRCNANGEVNWDKAPVYHSSELIGRENVVLIQRKGKLTALEVYKQAKAEKLSSEETKQLYIDNGIIIKRPV